MSHVSPIPRYHLILFGHSPRKMKMLPLATFLGPSWCQCMPYPLCSLSPQPC
ncbi:hypothetical protein BKA81DRAFT_358132 [Phyllosticta paracitricarpa]